MDTIRVGVVGAGADGWAAASHLPALAALPQYRLTAVATTRQATADETARRFGVPHALASAEALIARDDVDLVVVSVRIMEHARLVRAALAAGKHVFCEWPLGTSTAEAKSLVAAAEAAGVRTVVGLHRRLSPGARYLRDLVQGGAIGRLRSVAIRRSMPALGGSRPARLAYLADARNGATLLSIMAAHSLDTVLQATGPLRAVSAVVARQFEHTRLYETGELLPVTSPDQVLLSGVLEGGAVLSAHYEEAKQHGFGAVVTFTGTTGNLELSGSDELSGAFGEEAGLHPLTVPEHYRWVAEPGEVASALWRGMPASERDVGHLYAALARDLREGTSTAPSFADALRLHRLVDAIATAAREGQQQPLAA